MMTAVGVAGGVHLFLPLRKHLSTAPWPASVLTDDNIGFSEATMLDQLTLRQIIAFIPVVILILAYAHKLKGVGT